MSQCQTASMPTKAIDFAGWRIDDLSIPVGSKAMARGGATWTASESTNHAAGTPSVRSSRTPSNGSCGETAASSPSRRRRSTYLIVLLERRDHTVSKDELLNRVWPETSVNENNLARQVSSLRRALGQRPDQHDFLVTVPGQGYRFVAGVQHLADARPDLHTTRDIDFHDTADSSMESVSAGNGDEPLSRLLDDPGPATTARDSNTSSRRWAWRLSLGTLAAASLGFLATTVAVLLPRSAGQNPHPRRTLQRITFDEAALPRDAAWAPDGQWVVYASDVPATLKSGSSALEIPTRSG